MNNQTPNTNNQIIIKIPITKVLRAKVINLNFGYLDIGHWNLSGIWDLVIGI
jgi:hypothetical protein